MNDYSEYENSIVTEVSDLRQISWMESLTLCSTLGFLMTEGFVSDKPACDIAAAINTFSEA